MRIGLFIRSHPSESLDTVLDRFVAAEESGFDTAWAGHTFEWDALSLLALAGRITRRIELGSWVVPTYPRHPVAMAQLALTAQAASGGRLALGIGVSHRTVIQKRMGIDYAGPLRHMREYLTVLSPLLAGERTLYRGEVFRIAAQLDAAAGAPPPILLAALGPRMLELAGQQAQGVAIWLGAERFVGDYALGQIEAGARAAGRACPRIVVGLPIAVSRDPGALDAVERLLASSSKLPAYRRVLEREGAATPAAVAIVGDESRVRDRLEALAALGVSDFNAIPVSIPADPGAERRTLDLLAGFARAATSASTRSASPSC
ncbi:MAG: LLM class F420-dependent oxidoreductase [Deltaproteobacteria bacterium]|nr:LLM class F420-dependent oxidoreductase [Deltaproteobacteria bacterium]